MFHLEWEIVFLSFANTSFFASNQLVFSRTARWAYVQRVNKLKTVSHTLSPVPFRWLGAIENDSKGKLLLYFYFLEGFKELGFGVVGC